MSYEHRPYNPNKGGISRSGHTVFHQPTDRHPADRRLNWGGWLLIIAIFAGLLAAVMGITVWADAPLEVAR